MQKGNRESILRVRARDAANVVAQDIIDSISALGSASVEVGLRRCPEPFDDNHDLCRKRIFTGSTSRQLKDTMRVATQYSAMVEVSLAQNNQQVVNDRTDFMMNPSGSNLSVRHELAKQVDVTVNWKFKNSDQSINVSAVVR